MVSAQTPQLILASASPRRRELLAHLGVAYTCVASTAEDHPPPPLPALHEHLPPLPVDLPADDHPTLIAWRKADDISRQHPNAIVLAADTEVVIDGMVLGKPRDEDHARAMIRRLAGRVHTVLSGLCLLIPLAYGVDGIVYEGRRALFDLVASRVRFRPLSDEEIAAYVALGESLDKAGGYGLQSGGAALIESIEGSYTNVVGFPLPAVARLLRTAGITPPVDPIQAYAAWLRSQGKEPAPWPTQP
ncbi:Maf family protein [Chloroflexus aggregans]|uniref:dTTP/UTP pyrophosphatase n=1 Tax=Chloroflexus aggregans (strain MD-66 / DSM 9485) TaxID=326427 RepID=B8G365_CHLAD|nr:Maf family protein [Chloroflexus aggregans]ACL25238.1 maf protein [Chloroflexus aggregans DSM 9485]